MLLACNFTPVPRRGYRVGALAAGRWREILNTDAEAYGGSGLGNICEAPQRRRIQPMDFPPRSN